MLGFQTFRSIPGLLTWEELRRHEAVMPLTLRQNAIPATLHSPLQCTGPHCMPTGGEKRKFLPPLYWQSLRLFHFLLPQARGMEFTSWFIFLVFLSWNLLTYAEKIPSNKLALIDCLPPPSLFPTPKPNSCTIPYKSLSFIYFLSNPIRSIKPSARAGAALAFHNFSKSFCLYTEELLSVIFLQNNIRLEF